MKSILKRRSIRRYTTQKVTEGQIRLLLEAAMCAPSAGNGRPWHFVVIDDRKTLEEIPRFHPYSKMLVEASLAILVCGDQSNERYGKYWVQDCSAATENILIAVEELGLGAVWLGIYPVDERVDGMRRLVEIPQGITPLSLISIGYPAETKPAADRYDESRVHINKW